MRKYFDENKNLMNIFFNKKKLDQKNFMKNI